MITPPEAFSIISENVSPLEVTVIELDNALGFCLAEDVIADRDIPPADRSAMDGYAVRSADLAGAPTSLRLIGEVAAGDEPDREVAEGTCIRILTGANIPPGADAVFMVEVTDESNGSVNFKTDIEPGANILKRGEDAKEGEVLLDKGIVIGPFQIGVCASVGKSFIKVHERPRVTIICTGAELKDVGADVGAHELRNTNGPALGAALANWGYPGVKYTVAPDDLEVLVSEIERAVSQYDVTLLTGGVSVGKYDYVREAVESVGATVRFHGVAMKPGKPVLYATLQGNRHIFGLPGPPLSAAVTFNEFALPAVRRLSGYPTDRMRPSFSAPLASKLHSKGGRLRYMLARLISAGGGPTVEPVESQSSADLVACGRADGAILVPPDKLELDAGDVVEFRPWRPLP